MAELSLLRRNQLQDLKTRLRLRSARLDERVEAPEEQRPFWYTHEDLTQDETAAFQSSHIADKIEHRLNGPGFVASSPSEHEDLGNLK